jgi:hypothetical protein
MTASARRPTYYQASGRPVDEEKRLRLIEAQRDHSLGRGLTEW